MKVSKLRCLFFIVVVGLMTSFSSCNSLKDIRQGIENKLQSNGKQKKKIVADHLAPDARMRFSMAYFEAIKCQENGDYSSAFDLFRYCLSLDSLSSAVYYTLSSYYYELKADSIATEYVKKAVDISPDNDTYLERYGRSLIGQKKYKEASEVYEKLADNARSRTDVLEVLVQLYEINRDYDGILRTLDRMEMIDGSSEDITLAKMHVYSQQGKKEKELAELQSLADKHPYDMNYRVMMGNWLLQNNRKQEAYNEYMNVLKKEPNNLAARLSLIDYHQADGQDSIANQMSREIISDRHCDIDTRRQLLRQIITYSEQQHRDSTEILNYLDTLIKNEPNINDFAILKAAYMTLKQMPADSIDAANRYILSISPDYSPARFRLVQSMWDKGNFDEVIDISLSGNDYNPDDMTFYYFLGMAYLQKDDIDQSLDAFRRGVSQINSESNADLVSDFYAVMGDLLHTKGLDKEAFEAYDSCLHWNPEHTACLNNYAYYLSVNGEQLDKAEKMSEQTIKAEPDNATYLDTYAWVLFMRGKYEEAKEYIDRMLATEEDHSNIVIEHAGDIYAKCGLTDEAVEFWKEALNDNPDNALLREKIEKRKYISHSKK